MEGHCIGQEPDHSTGVSRLQRQRRYKAIALEIRVMGIATPNKAALGDRDRDGDLKPAGVVHIHLSSCGYIHHPTP